MDWNDFLSSSFRQLSCWRSGRIDSRPWKLEISNSKHAREKSPIRGSTLEESTDAENKNYHGRSTSGSETVSPCRLQLGCSQIAGADTGRPSTTNAIKAHDQQSLPQIDLRGGLFRMVETMMGKASSAHAHGHPSQATDARSVSWHRPDALRSPILLDETGPVAYFWSETAPATPLFGVMMLCSH